MANKGKKGWWFEIYRDLNREWRWRLHAGNGRTIGDSAEGYRNHAHVVKMVDSMRALTGAAVVYYGEGSEP